MKNQFLKELTDKFFLRFHMSLILSLVVMSGFFSSKALYYLGVTNLTLRYTLSFLISYACFFLFVRIWLWYIFSTRKDKEESSDFWPDFDFWFFSSGKSKSPSWTGKGGGASGGGASSNFGEKAAMVGETKMGAIVAVPNNSSSDSSGISLPSIDLELDEGAPLIVALLVIGVILVAICSLLFLVFNAPVVLGEVAFQLALSIGIIKSADRKAHPFEWLSTSFQKTWYFALGILVLIVATTLTINHYNPEITKSSEIKTWILTKKIEK